MWITHIKLNWFLWEEQLLLGQEKTEYILDS